MDPLLLVVLVTFFAFMLLAFLLLYPVYRFLDREEEHSKRWTRDRLRRRVKGEPAEVDDSVANGSSGR